MTETMQVRGGVPERRWRIAGASRAAGLVTLSIQIVDAADEGGGLALSGSATTADPDGRRIWRGAFTNASGQTLGGVRAQLRFLDPSGRSVAELSGGRDRMSPGEALALRAALPPEASLLQVVWLRWRTGSAAVTTGPYRVRSLDEPRH